MDQFSIFVWDCKTATTMRAAEAQDKVDGGTVLHFVVRECVAIFQLATPIEQSLHSRVNFCPFLNLDLDARNGVSWFNHQKETTILPCFLDKDLHVFSSQIRIRKIPYGCVPIFFLGRLYLSIIMSLQEIQESSFTRFFNLQRTYTPTFMVFVMCHS